jgi:hypothetical protein
MAQIRAFIAVGLIGFAGSIGLGGPPVAAQEAPECVPVGDGTGTQVFVSLSEWRVEADPASVQAGKTTFRVKNDGGEVHELVVVKGDRPEALPVKQGAVDEGALPAGAFIGEVEGFKSGGVCPGTFDLQPGKYVLFCNIVETQPYGRLESHYELGMRTAFTVTAPVPAPATEAVPGGAAGAPDAARAPSGAPSPAAAPAPSAAGATPVSERAPAAPSAPATSPDTMPRTGTASRGLLTLAGTALAVGGLGFAAGPARRRKTRP